MLERTFDLNHPDFVRDPYPLLAEFRERAPLFYEPRWNQVYVTRYDDIAFFLKDKRLGRTMSPVVPATSDSRLSAFNRYNTQHMLDTEPPRHTRMKSLAMKAFTPQRVEAMRNHIQAVVNRLLDAVESRGGMDLRADFAEPLPVIVIGELLGVPKADWPKLRPWTQAIVRMYEIGYSDDDATAAERASQEFMDYVSAMARERRLHPTDDLVSALVHAEEHGDRLTEDELVANCILLLIGGHETTVNSILAGMLALQRNPEQKALLIEEAQHSGANTSPLFKTAVEEMLRYDTPSPLFERYVLEDFEYAGETLKRGTELALILASGNRDGRKFERADEMDVSRTENPHLAFGLGIHYCAGAPLARLEMQIAFQTLLRRLPKIQVTLDPPEYSGFVLRAIQHLPVTF